MSTVHCNGAVTKEEAEAIIWVVVYLRCSSPEQELSVADQWREVEPYCQRKGYRVLRIYTDEGKSASKETEKRVEFNQMLADSVKGEFKVVVCWDAARFTRMHNIEESWPKQTLYRSGVFLDTVKEGEFDWSKPEGRWKDMAYCEANKAAALNLSLDSIRGRVNVLKLGYWPVGVVPYGYDREYVCEGRTMFVKRHDNFRKGKGWHLRLVVNEEEVPVVREIFDLYVNRRWSWRQIGIKLTNDKVPPPKGMNKWTTGAWNAESVGAILRDKAYIGFAVIGDGRSRQKVAHNRVKLQERAECCPPIVEPHVWHEAQKVMKESRDRRSKPQSKRAGLLSGFLYCGKCGFSLSKRDVKGKARYGCNSRGIRPHLGCEHWGVNEDKLLPRVLKWLVQTVDETKVNEIQMSPPQDDGMSAEESLLAKQEAALAAKVESAMESALLAPKEMQAAAWEKVKAWKEDLESVRQQLATVRAVRSAPEFSAFGEWWAKVRGQIVWVENPPEPYRDSNEVGGVRLDEPVEVDVLMTASVPMENVACSQHVPIEKDKLRALLGRLGFTCKLWWERNEGRKRMRDPLWVVKDVQIGAEIDLSFISFMPDSNCCTDARSCESDRSDQRYGPTLAHVR